MHSTRAKPESRGRPRQARPYGRPPPSSSRAPSSSYSLSPPPSQGQHYESQPLILLPSQHPTSRSGNRAISFPRDAPNSNSLPPRLRAIQEFDHQSLIPGRSSWDSCSQLDLQQPVPNLPWFPSLPAYYPPLDVPQQHFAPPWVLWEDLKSSSRESSGPISEDLIRSIRGHSITSFPPSSVATILPPQFYQSVPSPANSLASGWCMSSNNHWGVSSSVPENFLVPNGYNFPYYPPHVDVNSYWTSSYPSTSHGSWLAPNSYPASSPAPSASSAHSGSSPGGGDLVRYRTPSASSPPGRSSGGRSTSSVQWVAALSTHLGYITPDRTGDSFTADYNISADWLFPNNESNFDASQQADAFARLSVELNRWAVPLMANTAAESLRTAYQAIYDDEQTNRYAATSGESMEWISNAARTLWARDLENTLPQRKGAPDDMSASPPFVYRFEIDLDNRDCNVQTSHIDSFSGTINIDVHLED